MKLSLVVIALLLTSVAFSQEAASNSQPAGIPAGTVLFAELTKSLDAKKLKVGDKVEAKTSTDILSRGEIIIPRNAKITGHITEVKAKSKDSPDSNLGIAFDQISVKGADWPFHAAVQAIAPPIQFAKPNSGEQPMNGGGLPGSRPLSGAARPATNNIPMTGKDADANPDAASSADGVLNQASQGIIGNKTWTLTAGTESSVIGAPKDNVHFDNASQLLLKTQ